MRSTRTRSRWLRAISIRSSSRRMRPAPKGLKDLTKKEPSTTEGQDGKRQPAGPNEERRGDSPTAEKPASYEEKILFRDPYATLAEIANSANQASGQRRAGALTSAEEEGLKGGDAYRDPFDPAIGSWRRRRPRTRTVSSTASQSRTLPRAITRPERGRASRRLAAPGRRCRRKRGSERRCVVSKPVAPAATGTCAVAGSTRRQCPGERAARRSSRCPGPMPPRRRVRRCGEGVRTARLRADPAADRQAASVRDRGCTVGHQGRRGTGGRGPSGRGRSSDQPDRRRELRHVRGRLGRTAARAHPRDRQDRAAADEASRHDHRPRPHR